MLLPPCPACPQGQNVHPRDGMLVPRTGCFSPGTARLPPGQDAFPQGQHACPRDRTLAPGDRTLTSHGQLHGGTLSSDCTDLGLALTSRPSFLPPQVVRAPTLSLAEAQLPVPAGLTRMVPAPVPWVFPALSRGGVGNRWGCPVEGSKLHLRTSSLLEPHYPTVGAADQSVSERPSVSSATTRGLVLRGQGAIAHLRIGLSSARTPQNRPATACQGPLRDTPKPCQPPPARAHRGMPHHIQGPARQHTPTCTFPCTRAGVHSLTDSHPLVGWDDTPPRRCPPHPLGVKAAPFSGRGPVAGGCRVAPDLHVGP